MKILVVDDEDSILLALKEVLTKAGYEVLLASNGQEAWEILNRDHIRFVITDLGMPKMDGFELCKLIRQKKSVEYVYIIMLTCYEEKGVKQKGLLEGADDYITKPFDIVELKLRVKVGERILSTEIHNLTVFYLAKMAETRNHERGFHLERVREYCRIITLELGKLTKYKSLITQEYCDNIYLASALHDIGKICIPDNILLKKEKLNEEEWLVMKTHSARGAEIIQHILDKYPKTPFLEIARDITFCHHEKYDGTGFPLGLKRERIPLAARIFALADAYDAITSKYRDKEGFSKDHVHSYITQNSGKHFDPDVVRSFLAKEHQFLTISQELQDDKKTKVLNENPTERLVIHYK